MCIRDRLGGDRAVLGDGQLAEIGELRAGLREQDVLAGRVGNGLGERFMGVTVDHGVDAGGVFDHSLGCPVIGRALDAEAVSYTHLGCTVRR